MFPPDSQAAAPPPPPVAVAVESAVPEAAPGPRLFWWLGIGVIVVDQIAKALVRSAVPLYDTHTVVPGFLNLVHVRNEGMAFGLLNAADFKYKWIITSGLAAIALFGIAFYARHLRPDERAARAGLSLILGGALGNLIDRLYAGYVVDFVDVYVGNWHFWAFNVADAAINVGAALVFLDLLFVRRHAPNSV